MQARECSTEKILMQLNPRVTPDLVWLCDGIALYFNDGAKTRCVTFRLENAVKNLNWASTTLISLLTLGTAEIAEALRYYSFHPSKWVKLFFKHNGVYYEYEGPNVGVYQTIVNKIEASICDVDADIKDHSAFSYYPPMTMGESIAPEHTFGAGAIYRQIGQSVNQALEECLIENLHLQNTDEQKFVSHRGWIETVADNFIYMLLLLGAGLLLYRLYMSITENNLLPQRLAAQAKSNIEINVEPIRDKSFEERLAEIGSKELAFVPKELCCVISHSVMNQPVMTNTGHTFDYESLTAWVKTQDKNPRCPVSKGIITSITDNLDKRQQIEAYVTGREELHRKKQAQSMQADGKSRGPCLN